MMEFFVRSLPSLLLTLRAKPNRRSEPDWHLAPRSRTQARNEVDVTATSWSVGVLRRFGPVAQHPTTTSLTIAIH